MTAGFNNNEAWIKCSALWGADPVYLLGTSVSYTQNNLISHKPITKVNPNVTTGEVSIGDSVNYTRRKGYNTYDGIGPMIISVDGQIDTYNLGIVSTYKTITPAVITTMIANGHRQFLFYDNRIGSAITHDPGQLSTSVPYTETGIPVVLMDYDMRTSTQENIINYRLNFREDR
jgi:hypothetical protein